MKQYQKATVNVENISLANHVADNCVIGLNYWDYSGCTGTMEGDELVYFASGACEVSVEQLESYCDTTAVGATTIYNS